MKIPLVTAFSGWRGIPWLIWLHSDIGPLLNLHEWHITYRVIRKHDKLYSEVALIDLQTAP